MDPSSDAAANEQEALKPSLTDESTPYEEALLKQISDIENRIKQIELGMASPTAIPPGIRAKMHALRKLQLQIVDKEAKFHRMAHEMEVAFQDEFNECHEAISRIVNGLEVPELPAESDECTDDAADQPKGVPEFWLTVLKSSFLDVLVQETDEPALRALTDVRSVLKNEPEPGFLLEFHFASNDFFTNEVLTKEYFLRCAPDPEAPSKFNGFEIYRCTGCTIDWKPGQNLNVQTHTESEGGPARVEPVNSFFNFFEPEKHTNADFGEAYNVALLECDFHHGYYIKETVIPRAVFLFLGENVSLNENWSNCCCDRCLHPDSLEDVDPSTTPENQDATSSHATNLAQTKEVQQAEF
uniref:Nucleosome assembly protein 1-like 4 n=1 Tax=Anopheles atroparvus TaxID=41427 RepID=A0A182J732_ANOAO